VVAGVAVAHVFSRWIATLIFLKVVRMEIDSMENAGMDIGSSIGLCLFFISKTKILDYGQETCRLKIFAYVIPI